MTHTASPTPPPGISGRRVTGWVIAGLVFIGIGLSYTLWTYNQLDAARLRSAVAWRGTAELLAERYQAAEVGLAESDTAGAAEVAFRQDFASSVDAFRTLSIISDQVAAAESVEKLLASHELPDAVRAALRPSTQLQSELTEYNQVRLRERVLLESFGGRILDIFLKFPDSHPLQLATAP
jgi:uncharacterized protein (DUF433 family)